MKQEFKPMSWKVKNFNCHTQVIEDYDVLKYREDMIKKLKKKYKTKEEFEKALRLEFRCQFWSRCEYELIIEFTEGERVLLKPWCGCRDKNYAIDMTDDTSFDWHRFAKEYIGKQVYRNEAKIDVWSQLEFVWHGFVDYVWNYRHKWQRSKKNELLDTF